MRSACAVLAALLAGCSAIVGTTPADVPCEIAGGVDPCPSGSRCIVGFCRGGCLPYELCNGVDDDCDEMTDEGLDADGDGFWPCGEQADCDDTNATIHPVDGSGQPVEVCNGVDDDCNPSTSDINGCGEGEVCLPREGRCARLDCSYPEYVGCAPDQHCDLTTLPAPSCRDNITGCTASSMCAGLVCDTGSGDCVRCSASFPCEGGQLCDDVTGECRVPTELGGDCNRDAECQSGRCFPAELLRLNSSARGICGAACCTDSDCISDQLCWAPGTGVRSCVPRARIMLTTGGPVCTGAATCGGGDCVFSSVMASTPAVEFSQYACGTGDGTGLLQCSADDECDSGVCLGEDPERLRLGFCTNACGSSLDCPNRQEIVLPDIFTERTFYGRCGSATTPTSVIPTCLYSRTPYAAGYDESVCTGDDQCRDLLCPSGAGERHCADVCCNSRSCGDGFLCTPNREGSNDLGLPIYRMRCLPEIAVTSP